jgi:hypothetical protein
MGYQMMPYLAGGAAAYGTYNKIHDQRQQRKDTLKLKQGELDIQKQSLADKEQQRKFDQGQADRNFYGGLYKDAQAPLLSPDSNLTPEQRAYQLQLVDEFQRHILGHGVSGLQPPQQAAPPPAPTVPMDMGAAPGAGDQFGLMSQMGPAFRAGEGQTPMPAPGGNPMEQLTSLFAGHPLAQVPDATRLRLEQQRLTNAGLGTKNSLDQNTLNVSNATLPEQIAAPGLKNLETQALTGQARAQADSNIAGVDKTRQEIAQGAQRFPAEMEGLGLKNAGMGLDNQKAELGMPFLADTLRADLNLKGAQADEHRQTAQFLGASKDPRIAEIKSRTDVNKATAQSIPARTQIAQDQANTNKMLAGIKAQQLQFEKAKLSGDLKLQDVTRQKMMAEIGKMQNDKLIPPEMSARINALKSELDAASRGGGVFASSRPAAQIYEELNQSLQGAGFVAQAQRVGLSQQRAISLYDTFSKSDGNVNKAIAAYSTALHQKKINQQDYNKTKELILELGRAYQQNGVGQPSTYKQQQDAKKKAITAPNLTNE